MRMFMYHITLLITCSLSWHFSLNIMFTPIRLYIFTFTRGVSLVSLNLSNEDINQCAQDSTTHLLANTHKCHPDSTVVSNHLMIIVQYYFQTHCSQTHRSTCTCIKIPHTVALALFTALGCFSFEYK